MSLCPAGLSVRCLCLAGLERRVGGVFPSGLHVSPLGSSTVSALLLLPQHLTGEPGLPPHIG